MQLNQFLVPGITSQRDSQAIIAALTSIPGVRCVHINTSGMSVRVEHEADVPVSALINAIKMAGYEEVAVLA